MFYGAHHLFVECNHCNVFLVSQQIDECKKSLEDNSMGGYNSDFNDNKFEPNVLFLQPCKMWCMSVCVMVCQRRL